MQEKFEAESVGFVDTFPPTPPPDPLHTAGPLDCVTYLIYARVLDAADANLNWSDAAAAILGCDIHLDPQAARLLWDTRLAQARLIVGEKLVQLAGESGAG